MLIGVILFTLLIVFMSAHYVLPVRNNKERMEIAKRLNRFMIGRRSPILVVKEGKLVNENKSRSGVGGGVALVDLDSAIVLERPWMIAAMETDQGSRYLDSQYQNTSQNPAVRVAGPGLTFISKGEKLRGIVDLRKQFRIMLDVMGYTSDGIEVNTNIYTIFTLGQPAEIIQVAYCEGNMARDLRILYIDPSTRVITKIVDELDGSDKKEIHRFAQAYLSQFEPNAPLGFYEKPLENPPYDLDENRITAAIYSQAHGNNLLESSDWTALPVQIASDVFRDMISNEVYESLYMPHDLEKFPLKELKSKFARRLRYSGVTSFQFIHRLDDRPPLEGQKVDHRYFRISTPQEVKSSKVLRNRGIKIIHAGFTELNPVDIKIKEQRLQNWRNRWIKDIDKTRSDVDVEFMRIRNRAWAEQQHDIISNLSQILSTPGYSDEMMLLRIFEIIEELSIDPTTQQFLPNETINILRDMRLWVMQNETHR